MAQMARPMTTLTMLARPRTRGFGGVFRSRRCGFAGGEAGGCAVVARPGVFSLVEHRLGHSASLAGQLHEQVAVPDGEVRMIGGGGDLAEPGQQRGTPQVGRTVQADQRALHQAANELAVPALAGQRVTDPGAPAVGAQARVAGHRTPGAGVPVEVERVAESEPDHIPERFAGKLGGRPVNDPGDGAVADEQVARPEVAMDHGALRAGRRQARGQRSEPAGQVRCPRIIWPARGDLGGDAVEQRDRRRLRHAVRVQRRQPVLRRREISAYRIGPGDVPELVIAGPHGHPGHHGGDAGQHPVHVEDAQMARQRLVHPG